MEHLAAEGAARDVVRHVQTLRKEAGFKLTDRIVVTYETESPVLLRALADWGDFVMAETLADRLERRDPCSAGKVVSIGGGAARLAVERV